MVALYVWVLFILRWIMSLLWFFLWCCHIVNWVNACLVWVSSLCLKIWLFLLLNSPLFHMHNKTINQLYANKGHHHTINTMHPPLLLTYYSLVLMLLEALYPNLAFWFLTYILVINCFPFVASKVMEGDDLLMYGFVGDNGDEEGKQRLQMNMCFNLMRL